MLIGACNKETLQASDSFNYNAIMFACNYDSVDLLELLLSAEINPKQVGTEDGSTALIIATSKGNVKFVRKLLEVVDLPHINHQSNTSTQKMTALMQAADRGDIETVKMLFEREADVFLTDFRGNTALDRAMQLSQKQSAEILADLSLTEEWNITKIYSFINSVRIARRCGMSEIAEKFDSFLASKNITYSCILQENNQNNAKPTVEYTGEGCAICLESMDREQLVEFEHPLDAGEKNVPHLFHKVCITQWIRKAGNSCPLCRRQGNISDVSFLK